MSLVAQFDDLIAADWKLPRHGNFWQVLEPASKHSLFEVGGSHSVAFTLDQKSSDRFPFFSESSKQGLRQANDAIVVAEVEGKPYVIAVEMKTSAKDKPKALKQIESGRHFINWIENLLCLHGHWSGQYLFCGIVSLKPRRQVRKGSTRKSAELPLPERSPHNGYPVFVFQNHPRVSVPDLVKKMIMS